VEFKFCSDTNPEAAQEAARNQHADLRRQLTRGSTTITAYTQVVLVGVCGVIYNDNTLMALQNLDLDKVHAQTVAEKLHKIAVKWMPHIITTRRTTEKTKTHTSQSHTHTTHTAAGTPAANPG